MGDTKRRKKSNPNFGKSREPIGLTHQVNIEEQLKQIEIELAKKSRDLGLESLQKDESPEASVNWHLWSDCEDVLLGGTLDTMIEVLDHWQSKHRGKSLSSNEVFKIRCEALKSGCVWFFPKALRPIAVHPEIAARRSDSANFAVIQHDPSLAKSYAQGM